MVVIYFYGYQAFAQELEDPCYRVLLEWAWTATRMRLGDKNPVVSWKLFFLLFFAMCWGAVTHSCSIILYYKMVYWGKQQWRDAGECTRYAKILLQLFDAKLYDLLFLGVFFFSYGSVKAWEKGHVGNGPMAFFIWLFF